MPIDMSQFDGLVDDIAAMSPQIKLATEAAVRTSTNEAEKSVLDRIVRAEGVKRAPLRDYRLFNTKKISYGNIWLGYNPVTSRFYPSFSNVRGVGVTINNKLIRGAFIRNVGGHSSVFRRANPTTRWSAGRPKTSSPNLPLEEARLELLKAAGEMRRIQEKTNARLSAKLDFELAKRLGL